ncbi:conserved hypothetical protein [Candidatus Sulfopaludibacter sp. SbA3]|nr:conserved hypothetical protein [Candidatus Sulfopaludibacter sp. SbA3]
MEMLQQMVSVAVVLGLLGGTLWWLRRRGLAQVSGLPGLPRRKSAALLQRVERLSLSPTHSLHLVRLADRAILIASSPSGCQVVESSPWSYLEKTQLEKVVEQRP